MKTTAYQELLAYVLDNAKNTGLLAAALEAAVPILTGIQRTDFRLVPAAQLDQVIVRESIASATGRPVKRLVMVSLSDLADRDRQECGILRSRVNGTSLGDRLIDHHADSLWRGLNSIDRYRLFSRLSDIEKKAATSADTASPWPKLESSLSTRVWSNVDDGVYYLLGQALAGNRRKVKKLLPLCRLLTQAIPLGEHKDEPGTWYILVA